jgi:aerobic-type carbon monoxide dehydrogenase small subunit (CoxS/CutS family)
MSLLDLLRDHLQLTGTKKGCDQGAINSDYRNDMETHQLMATEIMPHFG